MPVAKLKASPSTDVMKTDGNNSLDSLSSSVIRDPFLSFSRPADSPMQWIQFLHALDQPGWPLLNPPKVQMQKCEKCSLEFFSSINYRRHMRVHHRMRRVDKDSTKNRDLLGAFWDKLHEDEAKEILSFKDVMLEGEPGSSILKSLTNLIRKPGFPTVPQHCLRAGSSLLDIVHTKPSRFPLSSLELFNILDDASEKTFLCGTALSMQKYVFDGEPGKIGLETKNLVACISFLLEQKLVKAWLADKDAEALRCQKLLMEEEEAAQRRQAELLERKRQKKLRQKEQKAKEQRQHENTDAWEHTELSQGSASPAEQSCYGTASFSDVYGPEVCPDHAASSFGILQLPEADQSVDLQVQNGLDSGHGVERRVFQGNNHRCLVVARWHMPSASLRNHLPNGPKVSINQKHENQKHVMHVPSANGNRKWNRKPKPEHDIEDFRPRVLKEAISQPDQNKKREVLIGSISVTLSCHHESDNFSEGQEDPMVEREDLMVEHEALMAEHQLPKKKNIQEKCSRPIPVQCGTSRSTLKQWRPVSQNGTRSSPQVVDSQLRTDRNLDEDEDNTQSSGSTLRSRAADDNVEKRLFPRKELCLGGRRFSSQGAAAFLAERWKEAMATKHVTLVLSPNLEPAGVAEASTAYIKKRNIGDGENHFSDKLHESSSAEATNAKLRTKSEKDVKLKYMPKQRIGD